MVDETSDETPILPGSGYRVHDPDRPEPEPIDPGHPGTPEQPGTPPSDREVLFDGTNLDRWEATDGGDPEWVVDPPTLIVSPGVGDIRTTDTFGDCHLHVEWATPETPQGDGQGRGNSGIFLMDRYELQVLGSFENSTYADGYAAAVYGQHPPLVNASRKPGRWQSYDILWRGPRFEDGDCVRPAEVTVLHNGIVVQDRTQLLGATVHSDRPRYEPHPPEGPIRLQDHGDRVRYRNIWLRSLPE